MIEFWENKKVLITGDSGFKGSWLTCLLLSFNSHIRGISLEPDSKKTLYKYLINDEKFKRFSNNNLYEHINIDIRKGEELKDAILDFEPEIIFHLAAQPLVRESYVKPKLTWETNVMGTINLLEAIRFLKKCSVIIVTTDKVYDNDSWQYSYRENDYLGGSDPYSASKAAVEHATKSWRKSFFKKDIQISTARAGNVIGGGDWAVDRIVPDTINALINETSLKMRYPEAIRPWQHVLDPLWGYICLAEKQTIKQKSYAYNFGPNPTDMMSVNELVKLISKHWGKELKIDLLQNQPPESSLLTLSIDKSLKELNWAPKWDLKKTLIKTVKWYKEVKNGASPYNCIMENIKSFLET